MRRALSILFLLAAMILVPSVAAYAQFKQDAFSQNYGTSEESDTAQAPMFSVKNYIRGLAHKDSLAIGTAFAGSTVVIGGQQIYNRQYWKLPIIYGGLGATVGLGFHYRNVWQKSLDSYNAALELDPETPYTVNDKAHLTSNILFASGALVYWGALMDGVINYKDPREHSPGKATLYSVLCPGLGQVYNGEYWKVPVYWGCLIGAVHYWSVNKTNYDKYHDIYIAASEDKSYSGPFSTETAIYYRDIFRRYRDYSVLAIAAFYLIQAIDANVFAYMQDFEVNDDLSMRIRPTIISPDLQYAAAPGAVGLSIGFRF